MNFFRKQISDFERETDGKEKNIFLFSACTWEDIGRNEIVMQKDSAFELQGTGFELFTSQSLGSDETILVGKDLADIKGDISFARVSLIELDEIEDEQKAHDIVRKIEYIKYHYFPKGYMIRTNSLSSAENVRVSKKAGATDSITLTGGCAKNEGLKQAIEKVLKIKVVNLAIDPQLMGALGAAEYARQKGLSK